MSERGHRLTRHELTTPIGRLLLFGSDDRLQALVFDDGWKRQRAALVRRFGAFEVTDGTLTSSRELRAYFDGDLGALDRIAVDTGGTPFQQRVWRQLRKVGAGTTRTYGEMAGALGAPLASRAVGAANGASPIAIVIPCHRLVGSTGSLTGYAFGLRRKKWLLEHEATYAAGS